MKKVFTVGEVLGFGILGAIAGALLASNPNKNLIHLIILEKSKELQENENFNEKESD